MAAGNGVMVPLATIDVLHNKLKNLKYYWE